MNRKYVKSLKEYQDVEFDEEKITQNRKIKRKTPMRSFIIEGLEK